MVNRGVVGKKQGLASNGLQSSVTTVITRGGESRSSVESAGIIAA
jgi:hypothetical protein